MVGRGGTTTEQYGSSGGGSFVLDREAMVGRGGMTTDQQYGSSGGGSFVLNREAMVGIGSTTTEQQYGSSGRSEGGSFALNREAKLGDASPESPKLWRPGVESQAAPHHAVLPQQAAPTRSSEDLYRFYATLGGSGQDLSLKDLVEHTMRPIQKGPLQEIRDREAGQAGGGAGGGGDQQQQQQQPNYNRTQAAMPVGQERAKVMVPPRANGADEGPSRPQKPGASRSFKEILQDKGPGPSSTRRSESVHRKYNSGTPDLSSSSRGQRGGGPRAAQPTAPKAAIFKPGYQTPPRSPRRPLGPSPLASPQTPASPLASAAPPARYGSRGPSAAMDWETPLASPGRGHWGEQMFSPSPKATIHPASSLHPDAPDEGYKFFLADLFNQKSAAPPFQKVHPTNRCSTCSSYTLFKTRCLVCGNIYCRSCVTEAMGSMPEGRKCTKTCVGRPLHSKYINEAGRGWCFCVPKAAKLAELKWARRRKSTYGHSMRSNSRHAGTHSSSDFSHNQNIPFRVSVSSNS